MKDGSAGGVPVSAEEQYDEQIDAAVEVAARAIGEVAVDDRPIDNLRSLPVSLREVFPDQMPEMASEAVLALFAAGWRPAVSADEYTPTTYKGIDHIEESGPLVRLDRHNLPDLDALMLEVYAWCVSEDLIYPDEGGDDPTSIPEANGEAQVGWFRKNPCACGNDHTFDMDELLLDDDGEPLDVRRRRGAFFGVYFTWNRRVSS